MSARVSLSLLFLAAVAVAFAVGISSSAAQQKEKAPAKQKWEYKVVVQQEPDGKAINDLGNDGWELVSTNVGKHYVQTSFTQHGAFVKGIKGDLVTNTVAYGRTVYVLKRPK
jgi:hypothetical protein